MGDCSPISAPEKTEKRNFLGPFQSPGCTSCSLLLLHQIPATAPLARRFCHSDVHTPRAQDRQHASRSTALQNGVSDSPVAHLFVPRPLTRATPEKSPPLPLPGAKIARKSETVRRKCENISSAREWESFRRVKCGYLKEFLFRPKKF